MQLAQWGASSSVPHQLLLHLSFSSSGSRATQSTVAYGPVVRAKSHKGLSLWRALDSDHLFPGGLSSCEAIILSDLWTSSTQGVWSHSNILLLCCLFFILICCLIPLFSVWVPVTKKGQRCKQIFNRKIIINLKVRERLQEKEVEAEWKEMWFCSWRWRQAG